MRINEVVQQVPLTRRAVKFYEEKGLLHVPKDSNGYRNYTEEHVRILQEICAYRKLGIGLEDIIAHRRFMRKLQDCGYNDIFLPNMMALSPEYKTYHDALDKINQRICKDLGLYYDSKFQLVLKNKR